jgi:hypothetical protein
MKLYVKVDFTLLSPAMVNATERSNRSKFHARNDRKYLVAGLEFRLDLHGTLLSTKNFFSEALSPLRGSLQSHCLPVAVLLVSD